MVAAFAEIFATHIARGLTLAVKQILINVNAFLKNGKLTSKAFASKSQGTNNFLNLKFKKMQTKKMSLSNMEGKLSRTEMKNIMAGSAGCSGSCNYGSTPGTCKICVEAWCKGRCYCSNGMGVCS